MPHVRYYVFSVYLSYTKDADIISWLESLPHLKRGETIKRVIRSSFGDLSSPTNLFASLFTNLHALKQFLAQGKCPWTPREIKEAVAALREVAEELNKYVGRSAQSES